MALSGTVLYVSVTQNFAHRDTGCQILASRRVGNCPINTVFLSLPFPLSLSFFPYTHTYTNISIYEIALLKCNSHTMVGKFEGCNRRYSAFLN